MKLNFRLFSLCFCLSLLMLVTAQEVTDSRVIRATLYRGQAQVVREVVIPEGTGGLELVISDLPSGILPYSLFAEAPEGIEVQALRYREREILPEEVDNSSALAQLAPQIKEVNQKNRGQCANAKYCSRAT